jgi:hypothetical protein
MNPTLFSRTLTTLGLRPALEPALLPGSHLLSKLLLLDQVEALRASALRDPRANFFDQALSNGWFWVRFLPGCARMSNSSPIRCS